MDQNDSYKPTICRNSHIAGSILLEDAFLSVAAPGCCALPPAASRAAPGPGDCQVTGSWELSQGPSGSSSSLNCGTVRDFDYRVGRLDIHILQEEF